jgi:hypothetical protein
MYDHTSGSHEGDERRDKGLTVEASPKDRITCMVRRARARNGQGRRRSITRVDAPDLLTEHAAKVIGETNSKLLT